MSPTCPKCGKPLVADPESRFCGSCLLGLGLCAATPEPNADASDVGALLTQPVEPLGVKLYEFGDYQLIEELARGGMGVVFRARQVSLNRTVALKLIGAGRLASAEQVRRFRTEAETAAKLDHPNIVPIYEIGEHNGQHYFAMKLMDGGSLARKLSDGKQRVSPEAAARLMASIARTVHFAHRHGILHRDLKPGNILLDNEGQPHITDFGLAKALMEGTDLTQTIAVLGTPHYMSPEQARGQVAELTVASDVYSLGAVLHELMTGEPPFTGGSMVEVLRRVIEEEPKRPSQIIRRKPGAAGAERALDRDLETICLKCLEKDPLRRYSSAAAVAEDLERWLAHEPVEARSATQRERVFKWTRRNPALALAMVLVVVVTIAGFLGVLTQMLRARKGEREAQRQLYAANVNLAYSAWEEGNLGRARALLDQTRPAAGEDDLRGFEWRAVWELCQPQSRHSITNVSAGLFWSDNHLLLARGNDVQIADVRGQASASLLTEPDGIQAICRSPGSTNLLVIATRSHQVKVWNVSERRVVATYKNHTNRIEALACSPDGRWIASAGDQTVWLSSATEPGVSSKLVARYPLGAFGVSFCQGGQQVATCGRDVRVRVFSVSPGSSAEVFLKIHTATLFDVMPSPDGRHLASAGADGRVIIWDLSSLQVHCEFAAHRSRILCLAWSPDGKWLASGARDQTIRIWDPTTGRQHSIFRGDREVTSIVFSPNGQLLLSQEGGTMARVWDLRSGHEPTLGFHETAVHAIGFSRDGLRLGSGSYFDFSVKLWDVLARRELATFHGHTESINAVCFLPDGKTLISGSSDQTVRLWQQEKEEAIAILTNQFPVFSVDISPDGRILAACGVPDDVASSASQSKYDLCLWDLPSRRRSWALRGNPEPACSLAFDRSGRYLAVGYDDGTVKLWEVVTRRLIHSWREHRGTAFYVAFSPDGKWLASGSTDTKVVLYDLANIRRTHQLRAHTDWVTSVAFSPDNRTLASSGLDGTPKLWSRATLEVALSLKDFRGSPIGRLAFSPDGNLLAIAGYDGSVQLWPADGLTESLQ